MSNLVARFLPSGSARFTLPQVSDAKAIDFPFLADLPETTDLDPSILKELEAYKADFQEHGGLIIRAAAPGLLNVSRQRFDQLLKKYGFWSAEHFEKTWYSCNQLKEFAAKRVDKNGGKHTHKAADVIKAAFSEFNN